MDYLQFLDSFIPAGEYKTGLGVSLDSITVAESQLKVQFSAQYTEFLQKFGWVSVRYVDIYGLGDDVPKHLNLVTETVGERTEMLPNLPVNLIPLMNDGFGNHYCLRSGRGDAEGDVVFWDHEKPPDQDLEVTNPDFESWFVEMVTSTIEPG